MCITLYAHTKLKSGAGFPPLLKKEAFFRGKGLTKMRSAPIIDRPTDRPTRQTKSVLLCCSEYVEQARPARSFFGLAAPFCTLMTGGDAG